MGVEDAIVEEEANSGKEEVDKDYLMMTTPTFDKIMEVHEEPSEDGGASMPDQASKTTPSNADTMAKSVTMKKNELASTS